MKYAGYDSIKELVDDVGFNKALEIIRDTVPPNNGDFTKEHKTMHACSDENTSAITKKLREDREKRTAMYSKESKQIDA